MSVVFLKMDICVITYFIIHCCHIIVIILFVVVLICFLITSAKVGIFSETTKLFVLNDVKRIILFMVRIVLFLFSNINII